MVRVFNMSNHKFRNFEVGIVQHLHGKLLEIEQYSARWEHLGNFLDFVKEHQQSDIFLYIVAPDYYKMKAMELGYRFYYFCNNGHICVYEVEKYKIDEIYCRKKPSNKRRYMKNHR